eukprot:gene13749-27194_t
MAASTGNKLRVLCCHGLLQSAPMFRTRIGSMRKGLKSRCEFEFIDAPYAVTTLPIHPSRTA